LVPAPARPEDDEPAAPVQNKEAKPDDWVTWSEELPRTTVDATNPFQSDGGGSAAFTRMKKAPEVQAMAKIDEDAAIAVPVAGGEGFDQDRIPASVFQPRTSVSQAEWSVTSNESLFSIHGSRQSVDLYAGGSSRPHFDYFYDEAMAAAEQDAEGAEPAWGAVPGSAGSQASGGSAKKAAVLQRHESGSGDSSSNFSFAFPMYAKVSSSYFLSTRHGRSSSSMFNAKT
jgi:hypothetical protein